MRRSLIAFLILTASSHAQPVFDVVSIKPAPPQAPGRTSVGMSVDSERLIYTNVTLRDVLSRAYRVQRYQVSGPEFIETERFDVAATIPSGVPDTQVPLMLQALLAERFGMIIHRESKELPIYALTVAKEGHRLKPATTSSGNMNSNSNRVAWHLVAQVTLPRFAEFLTERLDRPVVDQTGVTGAFEITLDWALDDSPNNAAAGPSIFTAVQEQLGLRLSATKGPVETIVVDRANKVPTEN